MTSKRDGDTPVSELFFALPPFIQDRGGIKREASWSYLSLVCNACSGNMSKHLVIFIMMH